MLFYLGQVVVLLTRVVVAVVLIVLGAWWLNSAWQMRGSGAAVLHWQYAAGGVLCILVGLMFLMSGWFLRFLAAGRSWPGRIMTAVFFIAVFAGGAAAGLVALYGSVDAARAALEAPDRMVAPVLGALAAIYALCFVIPGFAYAPFRRDEQIEARVMAEVTYRVRRQAWSENQVWSWWSKPLMLPLLIVIGFAGYGHKGASAHWLSAPWVLEWVDQWGYVVALGIGAVTFLGFAGVPMTGWLGRRAPWMSRLIALGVTGVVLLFAIGPALRAGMPAIAHLALERVDGAPLVTVRALSDGTARRCRQVITVTWEQSPDTAGVICNPPDDLWAGLRPGDKLVLDGRQSILGIKFRTIALAPAP